MKVWMKIMLVLLLLLSLVIPSYATMDWASTQEEADDFLSRGDKRKSRN